MKASPCRMRPQSGHEIVLSRNRSGFKSEGDTQIHVHPPAVLQKCQSLFRISFPFEPSSSPLFYRMNSDRDTENVRSPQPPPHPAVLLARTGRSFALHHTAVRTTAVRVASFSLYTAASKPHTNAIHMCRQTHTRLLSVLGHFFPTQCRTTFDFWSFRHASG